MTQLAFLVFSAVVVVAAWRVVTSPNIVRSALALMVVLGGMAPLFVLLAAEFVATIQVLVYVGAVVVLFLFGIMLTRSPEVKLPTGSRLRVPGVLVGLSLFAVLALSIRDAFGNQEIDVRSVGTTREVGDTLLRTHVVAFEVASVLLLAALVGAIVLARRD
jgi:NADH-quinone oxidoreductase subunit J